MPIQISKVIPILKRQSWYERMCEKEKNMRKEKKNVPKLISFRVWICLRSQRGNWTSTGILVFRSSWICSFHTFTSLSEIRWEKVTREGKPGFVAKIALVAVNFPSDKYSEYFPSKKNEGRNKEWKKIACFSWNIHNSVISKPPRHPSETTIPPSVTRDSKQLSYINVALFPFRPLSHLRFSILGFSTFYQRE